MYLKCIFANYATVILYQEEVLHVYIWSTSAGTEVDFVIEAEGKLISIEVKLSATQWPKMASGLNTFRKDFGKKAAPGYLVHPGNVRLPRGGGIVAIPFTELRYCFLLFQTLSS